jgi:hypothetical protein
MALVPFFRRLIEKKIVLSISAMVFADIVKLRAVKQSLAGVSAGRGGGSADATARCGTDRGRAPAAGARERH